MISCTLILVDSIWAVSTTMQWLTCELDLLHEGFDYQSTMKCHDRKNLKQVKTYGKGQANACKIELVDQMEFQTLGGDNLSVGVLMLNYTRID